MHQTYTADVINASQAAREHDERVVGCLEQLTDGAVLFITLFDFFYEQQ